MIYSGRDKDNRAKECVVRTNIIHNKYLPNTAECRYISSHILRYAPEGNKLKNKTKDLYSRIKEIIKEKSRNNSSNFDHFVIMVVVHAVVFNIVCQKPHGI